MRKFYKTCRNKLVNLLENCAFSDKLTIMELDAGLHFLLKVDTSLSDPELTALLARSGLRVHALSEYYHTSREDLHVLVINYAGLKEEIVENALYQLERAL
jgi:GntR family transcriptional regulator/MocR family aminotransferase